MEYDPPIDKRSTSQLMEVIESPNEWNPDIVVLAQEELLKRGVSVKKQQARKKSVGKYRNRVNTIKSKATYSTFEKILILFVGPLLFILLWDLFLFQGGDGFKQKNRQGLFYLLLGISLWTLLILIFAR